MKKSVYIFLLFLTACAPGFGSNVPAPVVTFKERIDQKLEFSPRVGVGSFLDRRNSPELVNINGRSVVANEGIGMSVQQGFEQALKDAGVRLALFNAPKISGTIVEWQAIVGPGFPASTITAKATVQIDAFSSEGKKVFNRKYSGEIEGKHPLMTEGRIRELLGVAMGYAINTAISDGDLQRVLK